MRKPDQDEHDYWWELMRQRGLGRWRECVPCLIWQAVGLIIVAGAIGFFVGYILGHNGHFIWRRNLIAYTGGIIVLGVFAILAGWTGLSHIKDP